EVGNVVRHDGTGADQRTLAYRDSGHDRRIAADRRTSPDARRDHLPIGLALQASVGIRGTRVAVVREYHAVPDEYFVFNGHAFAEERVRGDLAACADRRVLLDLDECADPRVVPDGATVEVDERRLEDSHAGSESYVVRDWHRARSPAG